MANALTFAGELVKNKVFDIAKAEFDAAEKRRPQQDSGRPEGAPPSPPPKRRRSRRPPPSPAPPASPASRSWTLEDAAKALWKAGIYAETGMGCTGPLVMMSEANHAKALEILKKAGYVG